MIVPHEADANVVAGTSAVVLGRAGPSAIAFTAADYVAVAATAGDRRKHAKLRKPGRPGGLEREIEHHGEQKRRG